MDFNKILNTMRGLFTGGKNLNPEINRLESQAVDLQDLNEANQSELNYMKSIPYLQKKAKEGGYIQPKATDIINVGNGAQAVASPQVMGTTATAPNQGVTFEQLLHGFGNFGATPSAEAVRTMADAPNRYPIYKKYPALLPALSIIETGAGKHITRPKTSPDPQNLMNWGIYTDFVPKTQQESVERALTGIGERTPYYQKFRETQDLNDFVNTYAPASDGNEGYMDNLLKAMAYFEL